VCEPRQGVRTAAFNPEDDVRAAPLIARIAHPLHADGRFMGFDLQPIDGSAIEEARFDGVG